MNAKQKDALQRSLRTLAGAIQKDDFIGAVEATADILTKLITAQGQVGEAAGHAADALVRVADAVEAAQRSGKK